MEIAEAVRRMGLADTYKDRHWSRAVKVTDNTVQKAEPARLEELLLALLEVERPTYPMRYGFEVALRRLATAPGDAGRVASVRAIAARGRTWCDVRYSLPEVAEWLACGQPVEHLLAVFADADPSDELAACLLQETALRHDATSAADVWRTLLAGAASGGAYGPGMQGAYGRRAAWESLAALAGVQETDIAVVEQAADRCTWLFYTSDWHLDIIPPLDAGVAGLRPDRRTVAVLAVTDAD